MISKKKCGILLREKKLYELLLLFPFSRKITKIGEEIKYVKFFSLA